LISVVTITYNNLPDLKKTLKSLPDLNKVESIVINGGTDENTVEYLKFYNGKVINEKDEGIADAFNKGIGHSSGDYIMFLNAGDELINTAYLYSSMEILDKSSEYSFVHSNLIFVDKSGSELFMRPPLRNVGRGMPYLHPTMIVRRELFDKIGGFKKEIKVAMDYDWVVRLEKHNFKGYYLKNDAPLKMDGRGKSVVEEGKAIRECFNILKANNYLNFKNLAGFIVRYLFYLVRSLMNVIGLGGLLLWLKKIKYSQKLLP
jgi:glycosyltransferase involved in cell wall biosynthesis